MGILAPRLDPFGQLILIPATLQGGEREGKKNKKVSHLIKYKKTIPKKLVECTKNTVQLQASKKHKQAAASNDERAGERTDEQITSIMRSVIIRAALHKDEII